MLGRIKNERFFCGLDIGSARIKAAMLKINDSKKLELIGVYENRIQGFQDVSVSDLHELSECIHKAVAELTKRSGAKIKEIHVGVGGGLVQARETNTVIPLIDRGSKVIAGGDVKKVNQQAKLLGIKMDEEIVHNLPQFYQVDDVDSALNPLGLYGRTLGVHSLMIISNINRLRNITKAVNQAGYDVANLFFNSYVGADIALSEENKKKGCLLIDIGSHVTSLLFFADGVLKYLDSFAIGGECFTRAIAQRLNLSFDLAEEIKKSYAAASSSDKYSEEEILVKRESQYIPIKRGDIYQAIEPQLQGLLESLDKSIRMSNCNEHINAGIFMIGGGSFLNGLIEQVAEHTHHSIQLGQVNIATQKPLSHAAMYISAVGAARKGYENSLGYTFSRNGNKHWAGKVTSKLKELYQEYF